MEPLEPRTVPATVSGTAFLDANSNGLLDPGEGAVPNVVVTATQQATNSTVSTNTDPTGHYEITGLTYGPWHITITAPAGYFVGTPSGGTADYYFSDPDNDAAQLDIGLGSVPPPPPPLPVISMTPVNIPEGDSGDVVFTRTGDLSGSLTVGYDVSGTATPGNQGVPGADYQTLSGSVRFDPGFATTTAPINTFPDDIPEPDGETVVLTIYPTGTYLLADNAASAMATNVITEAPVIITLSPQPYIPINANIDDKSRWKKIPGTNDDLVGMPLLRDMDFAPSRDISTWDGTGELPDGPAINDPDLKIMTARVTNGAAAGEIKVQVIYGDGVTGGRVNLWTDQSKTTPVLLDAGGLSTGGTATLSGYPTSNFYVEGIRPSGAENDITIRVSYTLGGRTYTADQTTTVTPVVNQFTIDAVAPGTNTFATFGGAVIGISGGDPAVSRPAVTYNADLNTRELQGDSLFLQNITALTHGNPTVELTDGTKYNPNFGTATFPIRDWVAAPGGFPALPFGAPFYPTGRTFVYDPNHKVVQSFDGPELGDRSFAGLLRSMDATFQARMYLVWVFPDKTIYSLARADWQTVFSAFTDADEHLNLDSSSVTTASPMVLSNANPGTILGPDYNDIIHAAGFWAEQ